MSKVSTKPTFSKPLFGTKRLDSMSEALNKIEDTSSTGIYWSREQLDIVQTVDQDLIYSNSHGNIAIVYIDEDVIEHMDNLLKESEEEGDNMWRKRDNFRRHIGSSKKTWRMVLRDT